MTVDTDIGTIAQAADDLLKLVSGIVQEREPLRHARIMNRLIDTLILKCRKTGIPAAVEVKATCFQLAPEVQQEITAAMQDELPPPSIAVQPKIFSSPQILKIMETTTTPLDLARKLAALIQRAALMPGAAKAKLFSAAAVAGINAVPLANPVSVESIISTLLQVLQKTAAISGINVFIKLSVIAQYIYADIETGRTDVFQLISQFVSAEKTISGLKKTAAAAKTPDPNLNADELSLATLLGTLSAQVAIYIGKANAAEYITAIITGVNNGNTTSTSDKLLVDDSFGAAIDLAKLINKPSLVTGLTVADNIYDDFAGGAVTVFNLEPRIKAELAKLKAAA